MDKTTKAAIEAAFREGYAEGYSNGSHDASNYERGQGYKHESNLKGDQDQAWIDSDAKAAIESCGDPYPVRIVRLVIDDEVVHPDQATS